MLRTLGIGLGFLWEPKALFLHTLTSFFLINRILAMNALVNDLALHYKYFIVCLEMYYL